MSNNPMQSVMKDLQDTMIVLAHIEKIQNASRELAQPDGRSAELQRRIEKNLAEIAESSTG